MRSSHRQAIALCSSLLSLGLLVACGGDEATNDWIGFNNAGGEAGAAGAEGGSAGEAGSAQEGGSAGSSSAGSGGEAGDAGAGNGEAGAGGNGEAGAGDAGLGGSEAAGGSDSGAGGSAGDAGGAAGSVAGAGGSMGGTAGAGGSIGGTGGAGGSMDGEGGVGGSVDGEGGAGGVAGAGGSVGTGGAGGSAGAGGTNSVGGAGGNAGTGGAGGSAGTGGAGGSAGAGDGWPSCEAQSAGFEATTLSQIWSKNPLDFTPVWLESQVVTAISFGACNAGYACQVFVQSAPTFASLAAGKHQGIKLQISEKAASRFSTIAVGDVVNIQGYALRYVANGYDELRLQVELEHPGCARKVSSTTPVPIQGVAIADLTHEAYAYDIGPLLVKVDAVKGKPASSTATFTLFESASSGSYEPDLDKIQLVTPYYLAGGAFTGLTPNTWTEFSSVTGVFSDYVRVDPSGPVRYRTLGPRVAADLVKKAP